MARQDKDITERRGSDFGANVLDMMVGLQTVDGGIRQSAKPEFFEWIDAVRKNLYHEK